MEITPNNDYLLIEPCQDPYGGKLRKLHVNNPMQYARIVKSAAGKGFEHLKEGAIIFFVGMTEDAQHRFAFPVNDDKRQYLLILQGYVLAYISAEQAKGIKGMTFDDKLAELRAQKASEIEVPGTDAVRKLEDQRRQLTLVR